MRRTSFRLLLLFVFVIPLEDTVQFSFGRLSKAVGLVAFAGWVLLVALRGRVRRPAPAMLAATALVGWCAASYFWSVDPDATIRKVATLAQALGILWIIWDQVQAPEHVVSILRAFVAGSVLAALLTMANAAMGDPADGSSRFAAGDVWPNSAGCMLAIAFCIAWHLSILERGRRAAALCMGAMPVLAVGVVLTASRTALVALGLGVVLMLVAGPRVASRRIRPFVAYATVGLLLAVLVVPGSTIDRLATTGSELTSGTLNHRTSVWRAAFEQFSERPIVGVGAGAFRGESDASGAPLTVAHNTFLSVAVELGTVGLGLLLLALGLAAFHMREAARSIRRTWLPACAAWIVGASALTWETRKVTWLVLALTLVQPALRPGRQTERPEADIPANTRAPESLRT